MDIYLYNKNKGDFIKFPVIPESVNVESKQDVETFKTIEQGELKLIGLKGARVIKLNSFFPVKEYAFNKDNTYKGMGYVDKIESWRNTRENMYITISDINVSFNCVIDNFTYGIKDGSGDIYYDINIYEYTQPELNITNTVNDDSTSSVQTSPVENPSPAPDLKGDVIAKSGLNVRSGPGIGYDILGTLTFGTWVKLYYWENDWWCMDYNGTTAWVSAFYIGGF